ncbi:uncharacterized protein PRCAT00002206001 [Priceomyces carsonii]|uniref:uncharacterized protein n=1 Tax=Priceomyces carsonii TaxID=28549 RepID=UPI002ED81763|nr:unnamed protein product [Priceomyces carsonii]
MVIQQENSQSSGSIPAITGQIDYSKAIHVFPGPLKPLRSTVLAYGASFVATTIGFPMDTVKTRMQTHKNFTSYFDCVKKTFRKEGTMGFFRGIWAPLLSTSLSKSLNVSLFTSSKPVCYELLYLNTKKENSLDPFYRNIPVCFVSGAIAGAGVSLFACPFEFTKIYSQISNLIQNNSMTQIPQKMQARNQINNSSTYNTFKKIIRYEGVPGLYSGYKYHLLRDSLSSGIYYSIYESIKWSVNSILHPSNEKASQFSILLAGGLSGIFCWAAIFPIDTTKSLIQKDAVTNILRHERGLEPFPMKHRKIIFEKRLYRGLGISVTRSFIVNMVFFGVYEFAMAHLI